MSIHRPRRERIRPEERCRLGRPGLNSQPGSSSDDSHPRNPLLEPTCSNPTAPPHSPFTVRLPHVYNGSELRYEDLSLKAKVILKRSKRGLVTIELPSSSVRHFGAGRQVRVEGQINGLVVKTVAFPTGTGRHLVFVNQRVRRILGIDFGDAVSVSFERRAPPAPISEPRELTEAIAKNRHKASAWHSLSSAARTIASTWIGHAKSPEVRTWRVSNVLSRAVRHYEGRGPFHPTNLERSHLGMPKKRAKST